MKWTRHIVLLLLVSLFVLNCEEDEIDNLREATFTLIIFNSGILNCNEGQLTFQFLITYPNQTQEFVSIAPTDAFQKTLPLVRDTESINLKVFFPSAEQPISEVNIPFIFNDVTEEELEPPGNELLVQYCHNDDNGITWDTFY